MFLLTIKNLWASDLTLRNYRRRRVRFISVNGHCNRRAEPARTSSNRRKGRLEQVQDLPDGRKMILGGDALEAAALPVGQGEIASRAIRALEVVHSVADIDTFRRIGTSRLGKVRKHGIGKRFMTLAVLGADNMVYVLDQCLHMYIFIELVAAAGGHAARRPPCGLDGCQDLLDPSQRA